ncbi:hypothetical protein [Herbaspirillum rubrisubalbicans]|uniref:hypothetical protein n=1 Tax=Herbaspirillum rubrisubalbicans TaxID=80842 RepID=UPI000A840B0B|nr:hypothetical protein [Herbaspirillum rubrisubalbicans]
MPIDNYSWNTLHQSGASNKELWKLEREITRDGVRPKDVDDAVKNGATLSDIKDALHERENRHKKEALGEISNG